MYTINRYLKYLIIIFLLTACVGCTVNRSNKGNNKTIYQGVGSVFFETTCKGSTFGYRLKDPHHVFHNAPQLVLNPTNKEMINKAYEYWRERIPDPTLRPQAIFKNTKFLCWAGVLYEKHPYHLLSRSATYNKLWKYHHMDIIFPRNEQEILSATKYFEDMAHYISKRSDAGWYAWRVDKQHKTIYVTDKIEYNRKLKAWVLGTKTIHSLFAHRLNLKDPHFAPTRRILVAPEFSKRLNAWIDVNDKLHSRYKEASQLAIISAIQDKRGDCYSNVQYYKKAPKLSDIEKLIHRKNPIYLISELFRKKHDVPDGVTRRYDIDKQIGSCLTRHRKTFDKIIANRQYFTIEQM